MWLGIDSLDNHFFDGGGGCMGSLNSLHSHHPRRWIFVISNSPCLHFPHYLLHSLFNLTMLSSLSCLIPSANVLPIQSCKEILNIHWQKGDGVQEWFLAIDGRIDCALDLRVKCPGFVIHPFPQFLCPTGVGQEGGLHDFFQFLSGLDWPIDDVDHGVVGEFANAIDHVLLGALLVVHLVETQQCEEDESDEEDVPDAILQGHSPRAFFLHRERLTSYL